MNRRYTQRCQQKGISILEIMLFIAIVSVGTIASGQHANRMQQAALYDKVKQNIFATLNALDLVYYQYCSAPNPKPNITPVFVLNNTHLNELDSLRDPVTGAAFGLSIDWDYPSKTRVVINNVDDDRANQILRSVGLGSHDAATNTVTIEHIPRLDSAFSPFATAPLFLDDPTTRPCNI